MLIYNANYAVTRRTLPFSVVQRTTELSSSKWLPAMRILDVRNDRKNRSLDYILLTRN